MTKEVFQAAKGRLKVVGRAGVGVDNVDLASATDTLRALPIRGAYFCPSATIALCLWQVLGAQVLKRRIRRLLSASNKR